MSYRKYFLMLSLCSALLIFNGCDDEGQDTIIEKSASVPEDEIEDETEDELSSDDISDDEYEIGDTIYFTSGLEMTITDTGIHTDDIGDLMGYKYVYIEVEMLNNGESTCTVNGSDMQFYADDYKLETSFPSNVNDSIIDTEISVGRKAKGKFFAEISNYDEVNIIEGQIGDAIIKIKDGYMTNDIAEEPDFEYGLYILNLNNEYDGWCELLIDNSLEENADTIYISAYENGNHETAYFYGNIIYFDNRVTAYDVDSDCTILIEQIEDGIRILIIDGTPSDALQVIQGNYYWDEGFDYSQIE